MTNPTEPAKTDSTELEKILNKSPIDKDVPDDIWGTIHGTWTGLWTDAYGEWDEKQPSDIYPISDLLSTEAEKRLLAAIQAHITRQVEAAEARMRKDIKAKWYKVGIRVGVHVIGEDLIQMPQSVIYLKNYMEFMRALSPHTEQKGGEDE